MNEYSYIVEKYVVIEKCIIKLTGVEFVGLGKSIDGKFYTTIKYSSGNTHSIPGDHIKDIWELINKS